MSCKCCSGGCPKCTEFVTAPCGSVVGPIVDYKCVTPAPLNRSTEVIGNRYGCELFAVCPLPENMFDADQVTALTNMMNSIMTYFHGYSTLNTGNCMDDRIMMGRDASCTDSWMGGIYPSPATPCSPAEAIPLAGGCSVNDEDTPVYRQRWTTTLPDPCCQIAVVDENGDPVLDPVTNEPVTEPTRLMFGAVPPSHAYLTEYGGIPNMPIDFDRIEPATSNKIANLLKAGIREIQKAAV